LYDLLDLEKALTSTLCDVLRADYNVLTTSLPKIDHWRLEEKAKRLLAIIHTKAKTLTHAYSDSSFATLLADGDKWGESEVNVPSEWNDLVLARVSDVHKHVTRFVDNVRVSVHIGEDAETINSIGSFLEAWRTIGREVKEYARLVSSL
jgi:hypothetical protein